MDTRISLATATGLPFVTLAFHVAAGTVGLLSGSVAIAVRKGGAWHRNAGRVFVVSMLAMGLSAVAIALIEGSANLTAGALSAYLVFTGWSAVGPDGTSDRRVAIPLMLLAFVFAAMGYAHAWNAWLQPGHRIDGVPAGMHAFMATIVLLAALGDARVLRSGALKGSRRLARHLWRMCFGLFIATGSFIAQLTRMTWMPSWTRSVPVILLLSAGPLVVLLFWMWRVRLRQNLRGLDVSAVVRTRTLF